MGAAPPGSGDALEWERHGLVMQDLNTTLGRRGIFEGGGVLGWQGYYTKSGERGQRSCRTYGSHNTHPQAQCMSRKRRECGSPSKP